MICFVIKVKIFENKHINVCLCHNNYYICKANDTNFKLTTMKSSTTRNLTKIDLTKEGNDKYTTYFYHKQSNDVYEVISDGTECAISLAVKNNISRSMSWSNKLPKYILKTLNV